MYLRWQCRRQIIQIPYYFLVQEAHLKYLRDYAVRIAMFQEQAMLLEILTLAVLLLLYLMVLVVFEFLILQYFEYQLGRVMVRGVLEEQVHSGNFISQRQIKEIQLNG